MVLLSSYLIVSDSLVFSCSFLSVISVPEALETDLFVFSFFSQILEFSSSDYAISIESLITKDAESTLSYFEELLFDSTVSRGLGVFSKLSFLIISLSSTFD